MKIEPRLPQLPSLGELLDHPRVKGLVERVNRSTLAQRAGGFLEEIRVSIAERAGRMEIPSVAQLAERLARRLLGEAHSAGPAINATGLVFGDPGLAPPLAEAALHAMVQWGGEYHRRDPDLVRATERSVSALTGGEACHAASSLAGAVTLAVGATAGNRVLAVSGDLDAPGPMDWRRVAARTSTVLLPSPTPLHSAGGGSPNTRPAAIVRAPECESTPLAELAAAKPADACLIDVAPLAGVLDPQPYGLDRVAPIGDRLTAGADVVVVDGAGLLGGPSCGLIVGRRRFVDAMAQHPLAPLLAVEPLTAAALDAVLAIHRGEGDAADAIHQLPVWQLLTAPAANLEQRARRLAALIADITGVATAEPREVESPWRRWGSQAWSARSWCIELRPVSGDAAGLAAKLGRGARPILVRVAEGSLQFDLRTVFPRWDQQLVAAVEGGLGAGAAAAEPIVAG